MYLYINCCSDIYIRAINMEFRRFYQKLILVTTDLTTYDRQ